jgi:hypothetical protein
MADREPSIRNDAVPWSNFDADEYWSNNYASVLPEDAEIIQCASKFLIEACGEPARLKQAVDVGAGTNLYPALLMLPWAERVVFTEFASPNVDWLSQDLADAPGEWRWQPFWDLVAGMPCYRAVEHPRRLLAAGHDVRTVSIFDLPPRTWDLGSMFFVADGMTTDQEEFEAAVAVPDGVHGRFNRIRRPRSALPVGGGHPAVPRRTAGQAPRRRRQRPADGQLRPQAQARV